jgi:hypothetical protein
MADTMKTREPGEDGSTVGQIKTPMCSENVDDQGDGKTHNYDKATGNPDTSGGAGIKGPGMQGKWTAGINITGSNNRKY